MYDMLQNNMLGDIIKIAHDAAKKDHNGQHYVTPYSLDIIDDVGKEAVRRNNYHLIREKQGRDLAIIDGFKNITDKLDTLNPNQLNNLSRLTALDAIVTNAVNSAERSVNYEKPKDQMKAFLKEHVGKAADKEAAVALLKEKLETMLLSFVHTMHPTIYHAPEARLFEAKLTEILENSDYHMKNTNASDPLRLTQEGMAKVAELFTNKPEKGDATAGFVERLAKDEISISPKRQMTVPLETQNEINNMLKIREQVKTVVNTWNDAVKEVEIEGLSNAHKQSLHISKERRHAMIEFRTWGQSADADGRDKSTSEALYAGLQNDLKAVDSDVPASAKLHEGKIYWGPTRDLRQNAAKVHVPYMSALVQIKIRNSEDVKRGRDGRYETREQRMAENNGKSFANFCEEFMHDRAEKYEHRNQTSEGLAWQGSTHSIFQQLNGMDFKDMRAADDRADFISDIINKNYKLIPDQFRVDTLEYNEKIYPIRKEFLKKYEKYIREAGHDPATIDYNEMLKVTVPYDINKPDGAKVALRPLWDAQVQKQGFEILHNGLQYSRLMSDGVTNPEQLLVKNFLQGTKGIGANGLEDLNEKERAGFADTAKRLFVIGDAIDKYGSKVATRYQIANFSQPSDFLIVLKLFQDTGIATIKDGKVTASKLAIQPLLETGEDLRNAPKIFTKLLANPLAKSLWQARGNEAEIMLGFSDGAASVGNFASQWEIYKATQELTKLFAKEGIKVRFFQGRGRGVDRGGSIDPSLQMDLLSPEAMQRAIYDVTLQSDLPTDLAASKPYGEEYFTKIMLGTLNASIKAPERIKEAHTPRMNQMEQDIQWLADRSAEVYQQTVRTNEAEGALRVLNKAPDHPFNSSRPKIRGGGKESKVFDDVRAIPKEYLMNGMDLKAHNVGIKTALQEFKDKFGEKRLHELNDHPYFAAITQTIRAGMSHYDPVIARAHAKVIGAEKFVESVIPHMEGLTEMLDIISGAMPQPKPGEKPMPLHKPSLSSVLDQIAHGIIVNGLSRPHNTTTPVVGRADQDLWADTLLNALFVTAQEVPPRALPERGRKEGMAA